MDVSRASSATEDSFQADGTQDPSALPKHNLTVCALIPGESRFLSEWLVYHRLLGVDHFALYDTSAGGAHGGTSTICKAIDAQSDSDLLHSCRD